MMAGSSLFAQSVPVYASTEVVSDIITNTTWAIEGSPYVISGNITIAPQSTLTISPGVTVKFAPEARLQAVGTIHAEGTSVSHISFDADTDGEDPSFSFWKGIFILPGGSLLCEYCDMSHAEFGVDIDSASSIISHTRLFKSERGISVNHSSITVDDSEISDIHGDAMSAFESSIITAHNVSLHDVQKGINIFNSSTFVADGLTIDTVTSSSDALEIFNNSSATLTNGTIKKSEAICVNVYSGGSIALTHSVVEDCNVGIAENAGGGINSISLDHTMVHDNAIGIYMMDGAITSTQSGIWGNESGFENYGVQSVSIENIWWGSASGPSHATNPSGTGNTISGTVDFSPWLTVNPFPEDPGESPPPTTPSVPLYTQYQSPYPSITETASWANMTYANGQNGSCGTTIAGCGCALTSAVMMLRAHGITTTQGQDVNPGTLNTWLKTHNGYSGGAINWMKIAEYANNAVKFVGRAGDSAEILTQYLNAGNPTIVNVKAKGNHFLLATHVLSNTYAVRDPSYYNTETLDDVAGIKKFDYNNTFLGQRLFVSNPSNTPAYYLHVGLQSPADILVTDSQGRRVGRNPETGEIFEEIPDSTYISETYDNQEGSVLQAHEWKSVYIPSPTVGTYTIHVRGTDEGSYTLQTLVHDAHGEVVSEHTATTFEGGITNYTLSYTSSIQPTVTLITLPDTQSPRARISFDKIMYQIKVAGDDTTGAAYISKQNNNYTLTDQVGNTTKFKLTSTILQLLHRRYTVHQIAQNTQQFPNLSATIDIAFTPFIITQTYSIPQQFIIITKYQLFTNRSTAEVRNAQNQIIETITKKGKINPELIILNGNLSYEL